MKKKYYILIINVFILLGWSITTFAQTTIAQSNNQVSLTTYIAPDIEATTKGATSTLSNKLNQIVNINGIGTSGLSRFIITTNVIVLSKDIIASAPPMIALTLDVTLYIGDGYDGNKFASHTMTIKGVDINEEKAFIDAIKNIKPNDVTLQSFVTTGKMKIIDFYNARCGQILKEAKLLESQNKFDEAIFKLTSIPDSNPECYNKAIEAIAPMYIKWINRDCKIKLQEASAIWNANQNVDAANAVGEILASIDPSAACFNDVRSFSNRVAKRVLELDDREWKYKIDSEITLKRDIIQAYRDVGVAYGNGQPKTIIYNTKGWW